MIPSMHALAKLFLTVLANVVNTLNVLPIASNVVPYQGHAVIKVFHPFWYRDKRRAQLWL